MFWTYSLQCTVMIGQVYGGYSIVVYSVKTSMLGEKV